MNPKVTVMVANYNTSQYLEQCLDSLIVQTYNDFEVLIVDDGSTDNSLEIIKSYIQTNERFRLIELDQNHGLTYVRHIALQKCKGEYIAILDADDVALPHRLEKQAHFLDKNPNVVLLGSYYGIIDSNGKVKRKMKFVPLTDVEIRWWLTFGNCFIHSSVMFRREEALNCGGYDNSILRGEDIDLNSKIISLGEAGALPETLVYWRSHNKSMTKYVKQNELDNYYLMVTQNALHLHTGQSVDREIAEAVFYNTKNAAMSLLVFKNGIKVLIKAFDVFFTADKPGLSILDQRRLSRCLLKHLLKIYDRNHEEAWWKEGQEIWRKALNKLFYQYHYRWYTDWREFRYKLKLCRFLWPL